VLIGGNRRQCNTDDLILEHAVNKGTILIVDDQRLMVRLILAILEGCGYEVLGAEHPDEALALAAAKGHQLRLLITDIRMGGMSGVELASQIVALCPKVCVLYMSGAEAEDLELEDGSRYCFIRKPFRNAEFRHSIETLIGKFVPSGE